MFDRDSGRVAYPSVGVIERWPRDRHGVLRPGIVKRLQPPPQFPQLAGISSTGHFLRSWLALRNRRSDIPQAVKCSSGFIAACDDIDRAVGNDF